MTAQPTEREREKARALLSSFGLHPRTCGPAKAAAICDRLAQALADARAEERERCARLIAKPPAGGWRSWEAAAAIRNQDLANG